MGPDEQARRRLDLGAAAGFEPARQATVLDEIARVAGPAPRIRLREDEQPGSKLVDAASPERLAAPRGRASYQLIGEIARGGMGVVMKGVDLDLGRDVALKVLHPELARKPAIVRRFVEEAQIGGQLQHPGIVPVYDLGLMSDQRPYFTMKLVKGRTLAALLADREDRSQDRRRLLDVLLATCQTVAYAHSRGVIHRDLKPSNVMVGAFGEVQVVDWGLAKVLRSGGDGDPRRERSDEGVQPSDAGAPTIETVRSKDEREDARSIVGSVMGTPSYMAPEQAAGRVDELDERVDVFALGSILCELLTGAPLYGGTHEEALHQARHARLAGALERLDRCDGDRELVALAKDCIAPTPADRPRTAEAVARRLQAHLASVEERARAAQIDAAEARVHAASERRARRLTAGLAGSVLLSIAVAVGGFAWVRAQREQGERATREQVDRALDDAATAHGARDWTRARAAVASANAALAAGRPTEPVKARLDELAASVERDAELDRVRLLREQRDAELVAKLAALGSRAATGRGGGWRARAALAGEFARVFRDYGIDLDAQDDEGVLASIRASAAREAICVGLDVWAAAQQVVDRGWSEAARRRLRLAALADPDPTRREIRDAVGAGDVARLEAIAGGMRGSAIEPTTAALLARALLNVRRLEPVIELLRDAYERTPDDASLARMLGAALADSGPANATEALRYGAVARALDPLDATARVVMFHAHHDLGENAAAIEHLRAAAEIDPERADVWNDLATTTDDPGEQMRFLRRALELDPALAEVRTNLGTLLHRAGSLDESIEHLRIAVRESPNFAGAWNQLGIALSKKGERDEGIASYRAALSIDPDFVDAYGNLALGLASAGDHRGAVENLSAALERAPGHPLLLLTRARSQVELADERGAIASLRAALERHEALADAHAELARLLANAADESLRDPAAARAAADRAVELAPDSPAALSALALARYRVDDMDGALATIERLRAAIQVLAPFERLLAALAAKRSGRAHELDAVCDEIDGAMTTRGAADASARELDRLRHEAERARRAAR